MRTALRAFALLLSLGLFPGPALAGGAPQSKGQWRCIAAVDAAAAAVAKAREGENELCLAAFGKGSLDRLGAASLRSCLARDGRGKVAKQVARLAKVLAKSCAAEPPDFGVGQGGDAERIAHLGAVQTTAAVLDALSENLFVTAAACGADAAGCRCQEGVIGKLDALADAVRSEFAACLGKALAAGAASPDALAACLDDPAHAGSVAADSRGRLARRADQIGRAATKRCGATATSDPFPGQCAGRSGAELGGCLALAARCRACLAIEATHGLDADCDLVDDGSADQSCPGGAVAQTTTLLPSAAKPPHTPGSPGAPAVTNPKLIEQFGGTDVDLNHAIYTRYAWRNPPKAQPDAILVLIPGFEGGAGGFKTLAEDLLPRAWVEHGQVLEVWAVDRRGQQLEDQLGLDLAESRGDAQLALDWLFGEQVGLPLSPELPRRAVFYASQDVPFIADWTPLVHSIDFDAVVEAARAAARGGNVFLGGHSAGTGFAARYAATDFDLTGAGPPQPGYAKLRGLVLLEGGGGSTSGGATDAATLDRIEQRFDGGLYAAVADGQPRCSDELTPCTPATASADCAAFVDTTCQPVSAYASLSGLLSPQLLASSTAVALQAAVDPDRGQSILQVDQGGVPGHSALAQVPELAPLALLPKATADGAIGLFVDDEGVAAAVARFIAISVGARGPVVDGLMTWLDVDEAASFPPCPGPKCVTPDNGPPPTALPGGVWGVEQESVRLDRLTTSFYAGQTDFTDWYYPSSGLSVTAGLPTLDSTALSADPPLGRGRRDIENLTQAPAIDIPVIAFGGSNGLTPVPGAYVPFASSIAPCAAPSCDGVTLRVVDPAAPSEAFPTFGDVAGGFEVHVTEGYAHVDVIAAEDGQDNHVLGPLADFLARNAP